MGEHHPVLYGAGRCGWRADCLCGRWRSSPFTTVSGAHIAFGRHLLRAAGAGPPAAVVCAPHRRHP